MGAIDGKDELPGSVGSIGSRIIVASENIQSSASKADPYQRDSTYQSRQSNAYDNQPRLQSDYARQLQKSMESGGTQLFGQVMQQETLRNQIYQDQNSSGDHNRIQSEFSVKHLLMQKFSSKDLKSSEERPQRYYEVEPKILVNEGPDTS